MRQIRRAWKISRLESENHFPGQGIFQRRVGLFQSALNGRLGKLFRRRKFFQELIDRCILRSRMRNQNDENGAKKSAAKETKSHPVSERLYRYVAEIETRMKNVCVPSSQRPTRDSLGAN